MLSFAIASGLGLAMASGVDGGGRRLTHRVDHQAELLADLTTMLAGQEQLTRDESVRLPGLDKDTGACLYIMHAHTGKGIQRSQPMRKQLDHQGVPYNLVAARHGKGGNWPLTCVDQNGIGPGYIGIWRSTLASWRRAETQCDQEWAIIFESDAIIPANFTQKASDALQFHPAAKAVWLDGRLGKGKGAQGCCAVATAWHRSIWPSMIGDYNPFNQTAWHADYKTNKARRPLVDSDACLSDWYLGNVVKGRNIEAASVPIVGHPDKKADKSERAKHTGKRRLYK